MHDCWLKWNLSLENDPRGEAPGKEKQTIILLSSDLQALGISEHGSQDLWPHG